MPANPLSFITLKQLQVKPAKNLLSSSPVQQARLFAMASPPREIKPREIKIDITSDSICPFCYIGKRKLERAISIAKDKGLNLSFKLQFHPFLLDPTLKEDTPVVKRDRYVSKFGGHERVQAMEKMMIERGKEVGIDFSYGGKLRQTTKSHRLISYAYDKGGQGMQLVLVERLFKGYFEQEQDIGDLEFLSEQAVSAGLFTTADEAKAWLATDEKKHEVTKEIRDAQMMGITGVPFFVINQKYAISGAEDPELFVEVFERFAGSKESPNSRVPSGLVCE